MKLLLILFLSIFCYSAKASVPSDISIASGSGNIDSDILETVYTAEVPESYQAYTYAVSHANDNAVSHANAQPDLNEIFAHFDHNPEYAGAE